MPFSTHTRTANMFKQTNVNKIQHADNSNEMEIMEVPLGPRTSLWLLSGLGTVCSIAVHVWWKWISASQRLYTPCYVEASSSGDSCTLKSGKRVVHINVRNVCSIDTVSNKGHAFLPKDESSGGLWTWLQKGRQQRQLMVDSLCSRSPASSIQRDSYICTPVFCCLCAELSREKIDYQKNINKSICRCYKSTLTLPPRHEAMNRLQQTVIRHQTPKIC